ncbi:cyanophycin synthetase [Candidatus Uhrbacteria bacterium]|nr:cyanophycin synthetase [Candidatus Uhrbacteria bacterium]
MKPSFITPILRELAQEMGVDMLIEPTYGYVGCIRLPNGKKRFFRNTCFDLNGSGSTEIAKDKDYAAFFLKELGYPVPLGQAFHTRRWCKAIDSNRTPEKAWEYAQSLGLPVIVKPNSKSQGSGVALAHNKREFFKAVTEASTNERVFLVQKPVQGKDYRIVVLDGEIISAYERRPLTIQGDGEKTIQELLQTKQAHFNSIGRDTVLDLKDPRILTTLKRNKLSLNSVIKRGEDIKLLPNANLSTGGDAVDLTPSLHPAWKKLCASLSRNMNLRYIGIDIMTETPLNQTPGDYTVIEINAAPGLDNYASIGETQMHIVKELYRKVLMAMLI